jgi:uncharacterized membrane protein
MKSSTIAGLGLFIGAAGIEAALIPGFLIGVAAVLAPKFLIRGRQHAQRKPSQRFASTVRPSKPAAAARGLSRVEAPDTTSAPFELKQAIFKTITFRMAATSLDFAANIVVIGNFTTAASLSAFGLVGAPIFYLGHEIFWNRLAPVGMKVDVGARLPLSGGRGLTINRALAKTITYEFVTTTVDFSANYIATRDVVDAAGLTVFAAVVSPFIYYGHEKLWDYFGAKNPLNDRQRLSPIPTKHTTWSSSTTSPLSRKSAFPMSEPEALPVPGEKLALK